MSLPEDPMLSALVEIGCAVDSGCLAIAAEVAVKAGLYETAGRLLAAVVMEAEHA
jgi:hypothetical protein